MIVVAEVGLVHNGSLSKALKLIDIAKEVGADAVKFQTHIAERETLINAPNPTYFKKESRFNYFKRTSFKLNDWIKIRKYTKKKKIKFFSSPFSIQAVDLLRKINVDAFKIASGEITNHPLLERINNTKKETFISSGMSNWTEISRAIKLLPKIKKKTLMQCTSMYPCKLNKAGLNIINQMKKRYKLPVGFSDHTQGITASIIATALGVDVIEKHLTISNKMYGSDAFFSLEPKEFKQMIAMIKETSQILNNPVDKNNIKCFKGMKIVFEKSIVLNKDMLQGQKIKYEDLDFKKPGIGIRADKIMKVIGKILKKNIKKDSILNYQDFK